MDGTWVDEDSGLVISESVNEPDKLVFLFMISGLEACLYIKRRSIESLITFLVEWAGIPIQEDADWWGEDEWT